MNRLTKGNVIMIDSFSDLETVIGKFIEQHRRLSDAYHDLFQAYQALDEKNKLLESQKIKASEQVKMMIEQLTVITQEVV
jgi:hypothetical protein